MPTIIWHGRHKTGCAFLHQKTGSEKDEPEINTSDGQVQCPVSYTHLDVYKRQQQCGCGNAGRTFGKIRRQKRALKDLCLTFPARFFIMQ